MTGRSDGFEGVVAFVVVEGMAVVVVVGTGGDGLKGVIVVVTGVGAAVGGGAAVAVVVATGGHGTGHCAGHGCGTGQFGGITQGTHGGWIG